MNCSVANDATRVKLKGSPVAEVHRSEMKVWSCTTQTTGTWNVKSMNQEKLGTVNQEMEHINIVLCGVSELKWTGMGYVQQTTTKCSNLEMSSSVAIILRQPLAQAVGGHNARSDGIISIICHGKPINIIISHVCAATTNTEDETESFAEISFFSMGHNQTDGMHRTERQFVLKIVSTELAFQILFLPS